MNTRWMDAIYNSYESSLLLYKGRERTFVQVGRSLNDVVEFGTDELDQIEYMARNSGNHKAMSNAVQGFGRRYNVEPLAVVALAEANNRLPANERFGRQSADMALALIADGFVLMSKDESIKAVKCIQFMAK